ncbi:MAG: hypothetical protein ISS93_00280 [Candidatus Aenigmarchaeota archaeon]|nr:hypothetical protein [Candidatus Aenigmarchaeota archaeon]
MKGQLVFEFVIAVVVFMGIVLFTLNSLNTNISIFTGNYFAYSLENKAVAASEALLKTKSGVIGVEKDWPVLDEVRIAALKDFCLVDENYPKLLSSLNLDDKPFGMYNVRLKIDWLDPPETRLDCKPPTGPSLPGNVSASHIKRIAVNETGGLLNISVWVW